MHSDSPLLVACAIIEQNGRILAAKRRRGDSHAGKWEFPGGKVRIEERAEDAVIREIKEELGTDIIIQKQLMSTGFVYPGKTVTIIPFICQFTGRTPVPLEHEEIRWVDIGESEKLDWLPPDREILDHYWHR